MDFDLDEVIAGYKTIAITYLRWIAPCDDHEAGVPGHEECTIDLTKRDRLVEYVDDIRLGRLDLAYFEGGQEHAITCQMSHIRVEWDAIGLARVALATLLFQHDMDWQRVNNLPPEVKQAQFRQLHLDNMAPYLTKAGQWYVSGVMDVGAVLIIFAAIGLMWLDGGFADGKPLDIEDEEHEVKGDPAIIDWLRRQMGEDADGV